MRLLLLILMIGCASAPIPSAAQQAAPADLPSVTLPAELDRVLRDYERNWRAGNEDSLAALFTEDGFALSSGRPPIRGRAAIREGYANSDGLLHLRALEFATAGDLGWIVGAYRWGDATTDNGKFVLALRRGAGGRWLIAADIDNSNGRRTP